MSARDDFPLSIPAYIADTQHFDLPQHGAYLLILMAMWRGGGTLKNDERLFANICKISVSRWRKIGGPIREILIVEGDRITQKRVKKDSENLAKILAANSANGRAGGLAKSLKSKEPSIATATVSPADRQAAEAGGYILSSDSDSVVKKERKQELAIDDGWPSDHLDLFWQAFPPYRREAKRKVGEKLARIRSIGKVPWNQIIGAVRRYAATDPGTYACAPLVWLNGERWDREYGPPQQTGGLNATNRNGGARGGGGHSIVSALLRRKIAARDAAGAQPGQDAAGGERGDGPDDPEVGVVDVEGSRKGPATSAPAHR